MKSNTKIKDIIDYYPIPKVCKNCGAEVIFTSNAEIYGREYGNGRCYKCTKCDSYVGVHTGTKVPLGILANKEEREMKKKCHDLFDELWHDSNQRTQVYKKLALALRIDIKRCHFGWFDYETLQRAYKIIKKICKKEMKK